MGNPIIDKFIQENYYFDELRKEDKTIIDKTGLIYKLASKRGLFYIARPKNFPKTPILTTIESLFKDGLKLFKGLKIENLGWNDKTYPVLHLQKFSGRIAKIQWLNQEYCKTFLQFKDEYNLDNLNLKGEDCVEDLEEIIKATDGEIVILIDRIDKHFESMIEISNDYQPMKYIFKRLLFVIQKYAHKIRFCLVTGTFRNTSLGIYEWPHPFTDLTFDEDYLTLFGFTDEDLDTYFSKELANAASVLEVSQEELREKLRTHYGNYSFDLTGKVKVYDPMDVHYFLNEPSWNFVSYWSDGEYFDFISRYALFEIYIRLNKEILKPLRDTYNISKHEFLDVEEVLEAPLPLILFFAGFYTIDHSDENSITIRKATKTIENLLFPKFLEEEADKKKSIYEWLHRIGQRDRNALPFLR